MMTTHVITPMFRNRVGNSQRGSALLIAMGALVLMTGLVIAFLSSSTSELRKANFYNTGSEVRGMAVVHHPFDNL